MINEFLKRTYKEQKESIIQGLIFIRPRIICNDEFSISVQASEFHYCTPRITSNTIDYEEVEAGYATSEEKDLEPYMESPNYYTNAVYGYVPVNIINDIITKHGGINEEKTYSSEIVPET